MRDNRAGKAPELLAPAGSMESVRAAVQSGAGAVYMGFGAFNARRGAHGFSRDEMTNAIAYCRARGVKTNITFNILITDRERDMALADALFLYEAGADALIVQDLGMARRLREHAPEIQLHASTQMTVNTLAGAQQAAQLGFSRVVLARECTLAQIAHITTHAGVETEVFVHGALCMCYSGQCYLSAVIGRRSGNRGMCAQPCRLPYAGTQLYPLSLKDLCLAQWLGELTRAGVASLKLEGRMKRPEYTAIVTKIYADLLREERKPTREEQNALQRVFSRNGFTDGYISGKQGIAMFGTKTEVPLAEVQSLYDEAAHRFDEGREASLVPVELSFRASAEGLSLRAVDAHAHEVVCTDAAPIEAAQNRPTTREEIDKLLHKTGGTPFALRDTKIELPAGVRIPAARINALRRDTLCALLEQRAQPPRRVWNLVADHALAHKLQPFSGYIVQTRTLAQITEELLAQKPAALYIPLTALADDLRHTAALTARFQVAAVLPRIYDDEEWKTLRAMLRKVKDCGVTAALVGNIGQITQIRAENMDVYGDFGLNATNSDTLDALAEMGVLRQTASIELRLAQLRDMRKPMQTELIIYGFLPLMIFENCIIRGKTGECTCKETPHTLTDRMGKQFPVLPEFGCRNTMLNSQPLVLAECAAYNDLGIAYGRLCFTTENPHRCAEATRAIMMGTTLESPVGATRGLYYRGVE